MKLRSRFCLFIAVAALLWPAIASADVDYSWSYSGSDFTASGTLQTQVFGGVTIATSGTGTLTYGANTASLTLIPNPCYPTPHAATYPGAGSFGCSGAPVATIHGFPDSGGGDLIFTDVITGGSTDGDGLAFTVTGSIVGGFNPWNNQAALFGTGAGGGVAVDNGAFTAVAETPEPEATSALATMLLGLCGFAAIVRRRRTQTSNSNY